MEEYELDYDVQEVRLSEEHVFKVTTVANEALPLEMLLDLETRREEISGQRLWEGSLLLCAYLVEACARQGAEKLDLTGRAVLELGAGTGLVSMLAHSLGAAPVVMTDGDDKCVAMAAQNVGENGIPAAQALVTVLRWGDAVSTAAFRDEFSVWETLRSQEEKRHPVGCNDGEESTSLVEEDRAAVLLRADEGAVGLAQSPTEIPTESPTELGQTRLGHRQQEEEEALPGSALAPPLELFNFILAGDVLYKHCLLAPFLGTVRDMLAPGGRMLLCHIPRAGVTYEIVEQAFGEEGFMFEVLNGGAKAVGGGANAGDGGDDGDVATAVGGVELCEDDARRARLYELRRLAKLAR